MHNNFSVFVVIGSTSVYKYDQFFYCIGYPYQKFRKIHPQLFLVITPANKQNYNLLPEVKNNQHH